MFNHLLQNLRNKLKNINKSDKYIKNPILLFYQVYCMLDIGFYGYKLIQPSYW